MAKKKAQNIPLPFISILKMRRVKIQIQRKNIPSHTGKNTLQWTFLEVTVVVFFE
jgi:hypothetical protein